jgi:hypothetical protein
MWENLADPIITGREEIGHPKLYAEIPELRIVQGAHHCAASWMGFKFLEMEVAALRYATASSTPVSAAVRWDADAEVPPAHGRLG